MSRRIILAVVLLAAAVLAGCRSSAPARPDAEAWRVEVYDAPDCHDAGNLIVTIHERQPAGASLTEGGCYWEDHYGGWVHRTRCSPTALRSASASRR